MCLLGKTPSAPSVSLSLLPTLPPAGSSGSILSDPEPSVAGPTSPYQQPPSPAVASGEGPDSFTVDEKEQHQSHCTHWARAQARAERYEEEVKLTVEEMGRTLQYFKWKSSWWQSISSERSQSSNPPPPNVQDGLHAYACRQSYVYDKLITLFVNDWHGFLSAHSLGLSWLCNYPLASHPVSPAQPSRGHRRPDTELPTTTNTSLGPTALLGAISSISGDGEKCASQPKTPFPIPDGATDAPLYSGSSDEGSDEDLCQRTILWSLFIFISLTTSTPSLTIPPFMILRLTNHTT